MFYLDSGDTVMPFDVKFKLLAGLADDAAHPDEVMDLIHGMPLRTVGEAVRFKFELFPGDPRMIVSWFALYRTMFPVWTWPADAELPLPNTEPGEEAPAPPRPRRAWLIPRSEART